MLSRYFLEFSVSVGAFVLGLSQISSFFSYSLHNMRCKEYFADVSSQNTCLEHIQNMTKLIINFTHFTISKSRWCLNYCA